MVQQGNGPAAGTGAAYYAAGDQANAARASQQRGQQLAMRKQAVEAELAQYGQSLDAAVQAEQQSLETWRSGLMDQVAQKEQEVSRMGALVRNPNTGAYIPPATPNGGQSGPFYAPPQGYPAGAFSPPAGYHGAYGQGGQVPAFDDGGLTSGQYSNVKVVPSPYGGYIIVDRTTGRATSLTTYPTYEQAFQAAGAPSNAPALPASPPPIPGNAVAQASVAPSSAAPYTGPQDLTAAMAAMPPVRPPVPQQTPGQVGAAIGSAVAPGLLPPSGAAPALPDKPPAIPPYQGGLATYSDEMKAAIKAREEALERERKEREQAERTGENIRSMGGYGQPQTAYLAKGGKAPGKARAMVGNKPPAIPGKAKPKGPPPVPRGANAVVGDGKQRGGPQQELIIDPEAVRRGQVKMAEGSRFAALKGGAMVVPVDENPKLEQLNRRVFPPQPGVPAKKTRRGFAPKVPGRR